MGPIRNKLCFEKVSTRQTPKQCPSWTTVNMSSIPDLCPSQLPNYSSPYKSHNLVATACRCLSKSKACHLALPLLHTARATQTGISALTGKREILSQPYNKQCPKGQCSKNSSGFSWAQPGLVNSQHSEDSLCMCLTKMMWRRLQKMMGREKD
jgi:hypothetical protein